MIEKSSVSLERTVLVGIITLNQPKHVLEEYLNELNFLTYTAGGTVIKRFTQKMSSPDPKTFLGKGKMEELSSYIKIHDINSVIFDDELSPAQQANVEKFLKCKIVDRTGLILDIFAQRAQTSYARNQVELAQYQYILPRLKGLWTHLERQKGGIGMRGPGETEIETDRRIVRNKINLLKKKLITIDKQMSTQRGNRGSLVRVALVGYTNVGKSTLMNSISKAKVFAEDKLFATLDTTVRKVVIENMPFLLTDTVGFIRKLPHHLVESFKTTLSEAQEADVLIHVICDALLGAANLGDIGKHFPDTLNEFKDIDSKILLKKVMVLIRDRGYESGNIDSTICLQAPKLTSYIGVMKEVLSKCMDIDKNLISIKATTTEKLGFVGREEGVSAYATILINKVRVS